MPHDSIVDLGDWAEDKFSSLCSHAGVTRNKSTQDRTGWDYLIEFPPPVISEIPGDLRQIDVSARVQVKSKRSGNASVRLKLSNALRFAKDPLPCFVVLFLASNGAEPVRIFSRHFWEEEIGQALKRAREAHAKEQENLNNLTVTLGFDSYDEHSSDLIAWMASVIAEHGDRYAEAKANLVRTLGFEDGFIHGNIRLNATDLEALVDHQIGLTPVAPALDITIKQRRFGIDVLTPLFQGTPTFSHMQSHPQLCRVRVRGLNSPDVWLDGQLFQPGVPGLPPDLIKFRVVAEFIEIVFRLTAAGDVTFHLDPGVHRSLPSLHALANLLAAAETGPLQFQVSKNEQILIQFSANIPIKKDSDTLDQLSKVIACLETVSIGSLPADLTLSLAEIGKSWNEIVGFNGLVAGTSMRLNFTLDRPMPADPGTAKSILFYDYVDIGGWTFMAVARRAILNFEINIADGVVECGDPRVVEATVRRGRGSDHLADLVELYRLSRNIEADGVLDLYSGSYRDGRSGMTGTPVLFFPPR